MKMIVFKCEEEELPRFEYYAKKYSVDLDIHAENPTLENANLAEGMDAVNILASTYIGPEILDVYKRCGVKLLVSRTIGMDHIDRNYAARIGIEVRNISYSPSSVADYAIMMMLMVLRHIKPMLQRYAGQDYAQKGYLGRELPNMTVGLIGLGRIGGTVARHLSGFGCRVLGYDTAEKPEFAPYVEQVSLDTLYQESDIVSLHIASTPETYHFIDRETIGHMKDGAVLINTGRGALVDNNALIESLENGKLSGAGLDVFEGDRPIYYRDHKNKPVQTHEMAILNAMPNVLMLPHMAYYTDQASDDMVRHSVETAVEFCSPS